MKKEVKEKWLAALRSGEYQQGTCRLRTGDKFCCLGVITDLYIKEHGKVWGFGDDQELAEMAHYFADSAIHIPKPVMEWAGIEDSCPKVKLPDREEPTYLTELNDGEEARDNLRQYTFVEIAALIEEQL